MKLLSILMSLVMMLSGGYMAEDPSAAAANIITIRDAIVTIDGEEYPLSPAITLGAASENGAALLDVGMPLGEDVLFPVQVKLTESGLGLLLGQSGTVYTLTPAFFEEMLDGAEIPDEITGMMESYVSLLSSMGNLTPASMLEQQKASTEKFMELIGDAPAEEASFTANGEEQNGKHVVFTLTNDQVAEYMDFCFKQMPEGYAEAYYGYMNTILGMAGMPEVNGFADILAMAGMEMSIDGHVTYNETSGVADLVFHTAVDPSAGSLTTELADSEIADSVEVTVGEPVSFDIPMVVTAHTPENMEYSMDMDVEGAQIVLNGSFVEGAQTVNMELTAEDEMVMNMDVNLLPADNNTMQTTVDMNMSVDGVSVDLGVDTVPNEKGSTTAFEFSVAEESISFGAEFAIDVTHDPIADRTADAAVAEINSAEELENNTGLAMAAMSLMGGAEKLMSDESIAALIEAVLQSYTVVEEEYAEVVEETSETADNSESTESVSSASSDLEFAWLPEGYELTQAERSSENYANYYFEYTADDDEYHSTLYLDTESYTDDDYSPRTYSYVVTDEGVQLLSDPVVTIERTGDDCVYGKYILDSGVILHASYYDSDLSDEDIIRFLTGITLQ